MQIQAILFQNLGEVGAGKSSLINLLLGTDLLPTHQLRCTNTICEIRSNRGGRKEAIAHPKSDSDGNSACENQMKKINLEGLKGKKNKTCVLTYSILDFTALGSFVLTCISIIKYLYQSV